MVLPQFIDRVVDIAVMLQRQDRDGPLGWPGKMQELWEGKYGLAAAVEGTIGSEFAALINRRRRRLGRALPWLVTTSRGVANRPPGASDGTSSSVESCGSD